MLKWNTKILFFILILLSFGSCEKDEEEQYSSSLLGEWEWFISSGGITGVIYPSEDYTVNLLFTPDSILYTYRNDSIYSTDEFTTFKIMSDNGVDTLKIISFGTVVQKYFIYNDTLVLQHISAPFGSGYLRIKQLHFP